MGAGAIMAAGSLAGGLAGKALGGDDQSSYGPDTSVMGVDQATIKKGGKGQPDVVIPQINITQALQWAQQAATTQDKYYRKGLEYYKDALQSASYEIKQGYNQAEQKLAPLSFSANSALNEQMKMLGLDPYTPTPGVDRDLEILADKYSKVFPASSPVMQNIAVQMQKADSLRDPEKRVSAKQQITKDMLAAGPAVAQEVQNKITALGARPELNVPAYIPVWEGGIDTGDPVMGLNPNYLRAVEQQKQFDQNLKGLQDQLGTATNLQADLTSLAGQYENKFVNTPEKGYTGNEITNKITSTPGYQFQFEQGQKAIERQAAARGQLLSGKTLLEAQTQGQELAKGHYGAYMDRLAQIVSEGSPATAQMAQNSIAKGSALAGLQQEGGRASMETEANVGQAYAQSLYNQSALYTDAAKFNAGLQYDAIQRGQDREAKQEAQSAASALGAAPGIMSQSLARDQFNYGIFQNQQAGQVLANAGGSKYGFSV